jgi:acyl dehydratase
MSTLIRGLTVDASLPALELPTIERTTLARFADASGDRNPVHTDPEAARAAGHDDVFAHGMLLMAYLGRALASWVPQAAIRSFGARFIAVTPIHARPTCSGTVTAVGAVDGEQLARLDLTVTLADGTVAVRGYATVAVSEPFDVSR